MVSQAKLAREIHYAVQKKQSKSSLFIQVPKSGVHHKQPIKTRMRSHCGCHLYFTITKSQSRLIEQLSRIKLLPLLPVLGGIIMKIVTSALPSPVFLCSICLKWNKKTNGWNWNYTCTLFLSLSCTHTHIHILCDFGNISNYVSRCTGTAGQKARL